MGLAGAARHTADADDLFGRIGAFLADHRLACDPATYALVHGIMTNPDGLLAVEVRRLTDGGVRLGGADIERLGGHVAAVAPVPARAPRPGKPAPEEDAARLVAETRAQVDGFADMMRSMQHETRDFGRDLAQGAAAAAALRDPSGLSQIAAAMADRVRNADARLAAATGEADALRAKLVDAQAAARRDPLTELPNRLAFAEAYAARADDGTALHCLALCDVDRFKRINDAHGHGIGDRVLTAIGETLTEACAGHLVARYGGEEFAVLLTGVSLADAAVHLDIARERIAAKRFRSRDTGESLGRITCSAGVVAIRAGESLDNATERADRLLYTAKGKGRDRVCAG